MSEASTGTEAVERRLAHGAAVLFLLGGLTGGLISSVQAGWLPLDEAHVRASHVNALLGALWLLGLGWSLRFSSLGERGLRALSWLTLTAAYGNWLITGVKAALHVHGTYLQGEARNDAILGALTAFVVLPSLGASVLWIAGFRKAER